MIDLEFEQISPLKSDSFRLRLRRMEEDCFYSLQLMKDEEESSVAGQSYEFQIDLNRNSELMQIRSADFNDRIYYQIDADHRTFYLQVKGETYVFRRVLSYDLDSGSQDSSSAVLAPMPGKILKVCVESGQDVDKDQELFVMESMKMESSLKAGKDGIVESVEVCEGDLVQADQILLKYKEEQNG